ncbi:MAG: polysaccharide biosynthesis C-terminal domain-containing protein [Synergistaceae bacterium]|nr:polysaccharide biosynthesis C-terminal domain-containing protein [Synergistaceae bacterium]
MRGVLSRLLAVKSARGVSFTITAVSMLSKPAGYLRTLIVAWAFGTGAGMDSFQMASGIIALFAGSVGQALDSVVLPELVRVRETTGDSYACRQIAALVSCLLILITALFCAAVLIAPGVLIGLFARGFDAERIRMGASMLWWLLPFAAITMYRPMLDLWALFTERFTLSVVCSSVFNFIAIPALLAGIPLIGVYSVAFCMSLGHLVGFTLFVIALKGAPVVWRRRNFPWRSVARIAKNFVFTMVLVSASTIFVVVDRYFASRLPSGSVAAISYAAGVIGIISIAASSPMSFFMSRISKLAVTDADESRGMVESTLALTIAYFIPASVFLTVSAKPLIALIYGWGNFDARSVDMTSTCLAAYSVGFAVSMSGTVLYRYAQAQQRLGAIVAMTYCLIAVNAFLDWAMVSRLGLLGLALATSITQTLSFVLYYAVVMRGSLPSFLIRMRFFRQILSALVLASGVWFAGRWGLAAQGASALVAAALYLATAERLNMMPCVPEHWRPSKLVSFLISAAKSYI